MFHDILAPQLLELHLCGCGYVTDFDVADICKVGHIYNILHFSSTSCALKCLFSVAPALVQ